MLNGKWREADGASLSFFSFARNGIFIFAGFELGFEKMRARHMAGAALFTGGFLNSP